MDEVPDTPPPLPAIPRGPLWIALSVPPIVTLLGNFVTGFYHGSDDYGLPFLWVPLVVFFVILGLSCRFYDAVGRRYRGRSLVFLRLAYFLGQIIVCLALWFGSCVLFMR